MLLHAAWTPFAHQGRPGAILPFDTAVQFTRAGRSQVSRSFRCLQDLGLAWVIQQGTRPNGPGGTRGLAAVWNLPFRMPGERPPPELLNLPPGVKRPEGKVRWNAGRLRQDTQQIPHHAFRLLVAAIAHMDRHQDGGLARPDPFPLGPAQARLWCKMARQTATKATRILLDLGRLVVAIQAAGRRPICVELARFYRKAEKIGPRPSLSP